MPALPGFRVVWSSFLKWFVFSSSSFLSLSVLTYCLRIFFKNFSRSCVSTFLVFLQAGITFFSGFFILLVFSSCHSGLEFLFVLWRCFYSDSSYKGTPVLLSLFHYVASLDGCCVYAFNNFFPPLFELAGFFPGPAANRRFDGIGRQARIIL